LLKETRRLKELSQFEAAAQSGISVDTWRAWEQGRFEPDFEMLGKLLKFFGPHAQPLLERLGIQAIAQTPDLAAERLRLRSEAQAKIQEATKGLVDTRRRR